jgi:hypothetical protein
MSLIIEYEDDAATQFLDFNNWKKLKIWTF